MILEVVGMILEELELFSWGLQDNFPLEHFFEHFAGVFFVHFCEHEELLWYVDDIDYLGSGFKYFFNFHPYLGKWSNLIQFVQRGWNQQL